MMKVLVTGSQGQLGQDLVRILGLSNEVVGMGRQELDITNLVQAREVVQRVRPDVIVHAAAYTAVDQAETEEEQAYRVNAYGSRNMALLAEECGAKFCYLSTDYVFDGTTQVPYREHDNTNPQSVYGKSKRAGEQLVQSVCSKSFIVRTSWVYGANGNNFVKTMLKLAQDRDRLTVVQDQIGSPTYTIDLCRFLADLIRTDQYGIYHASNTGYCSWYEFAKAIFEEAGKDMTVVPCSTEQFPRPAARPKYSVMEHLAIRANGLRDLPNWREGLRAFFQEIKGE